MKPSTLLVFASVVATLTGVVAAHAAVGDTVRFRTCTQPGVEHGCVLATGLDGKIYNVTGARAGLTPFQWLQGSGVVTNKMSFCMQGAVIDHYKDDPNQNLPACLDPSKVKGLPKP